MLSEKFLVQSCRFCLSSPTHQPNGKAKPRGGALHKLFLLFPLRECVLQRVARFLLQLLCVCWFHAYFWVRNQHASDAQFFTDAWEDLFLFYLFELNLWSELTNPAPRLPGFHTQPGLFSWLPVTSTNVPMISPIMWQRQGRR
jgi:hypothetical protein